MCIRDRLCNHFIAFKLLALIRDKVFGALRRLAPAKLEGRDKGNLISLLTSDIELLEVFYAHTTVSYTHLDVYKRQLIPYRLSPLRSSYR